MRVAWLPLALSGAVLLPAPAAAQSDCVAPPGNAAVEQYCEIIPNDATGRGTGGRKLGGSRKVGPETVRAIAERGRDGSALAELLVPGSAGAGVGAGSGGPDSRSTDPGFDKTRLAPGGGVAREAGTTGIDPGVVAKSVADGPSAGGTLAAILLAITAFFGGWGYLRVRRNARDDA